MVLAGPGRQASKPLPGLATKEKTVIKELQHWLGYYAATVVCWISSKLDTVLWEDGEDAEV